MHVRPRTLGPIRYGSPMADLVGKILDTSTIESQIVQAVATGVVTATLAPARLPPALVMASHVAMGVLGAAGGALVAGEDTTASRRAAAAGVAGAVLASTSWVGVVADQRVERWLRRRGVRSPRLVIGVCAAAMTFALARVEAMSAEPKSSREG